MGEIFYGRGFMESFYLDTQSKRRSSSLSLLSHQQFNFIGLMRPRSRTLTKKPEDQEESPPTTVKADAHNEVKNVKIYLRRANKTTKIVTFPHQILLNQIFVLVEKELGIPRNSQVLFFKGNKISVSTDASPTDKTLQFQEKDIVHVHTSASPPKTQFKVSLEYLSPENLKFKEISFMMKSTENIENSLSRAMGQPLEQITKETFIQSGRKLQFGKKPQEQFIEEGSVITVINKKNQALKKQIAQQIESLLDFPVPQKAKLVKHSTSLDDGLQGSPDFKKKQKGICLYKSYHMPESKEVIWESDSSTQFNKRSLLKNLYRKKAHNEKEKQEKKKSTISISSESSSNSGQNVFTLTDKLELKQQIKKLFQSDCLHNQTELKKLEPPKFSINDCFIEDVEEIEIDCDERDQKSHSESDSDSSEEKDHFDLKQKQGGMNLKSSFGGAKQLYSSLPLDLRKSIGKTKGNFTPVPLIPTRDFDQDNEMEI